MAMTPEEIQKEMRERGLSLAAIAKRARPKLPRQSIWANVHQLRGAKSARARRLIAKAIGRSVEEVFGSAA